MPCFSIKKNIPVLYNHCHANMSYNFKSTDSEEKYIENKKKYGESWYYHDKKIDYTYNSWGYRTKEFKKLKKDYILTFGCSFTEGNGLSTEDLWVNLLANKLGYDSFNLASEATGIDFQFYNTVLFSNFLSKNGKLPKAVIYQWPFETRSGFFMHRKDIINFDTFSHHYEIGDESKLYDDYYKWYSQSFITDGAEKYKHTNIYITACNNLWKSMNIPVINWTYEKNILPKNSFVKIHTILDKSKIYARDCCHNGHLGQQKVAENLYNILQKI